MPEKGRRPQASGNVAAAPAETGPKDRTEAGRRRGRRGRRGRGRPEGFNRPEGETGTSTPAARTGPAEYQAGAPVMPVVPERSEPRSFAVESFATPPPERPAPAPVEERATEKPAADTDRTNG